MSVSRTIGFTLIPLLVTILIASVVVGGFFYLLNAEHAKTRDAKRLADMSRVQAAFELLYAQQASYVSASSGCDTIGDPVSDCALQDILPGIGTFTDPGSAAYIVSYIPDDQKYEVTFELERSYGDLTAGLHTISPEGLQ